jgi:hypothetical protein
MKLPSGFVINISFINQSRILRFQGDDRSVINGKNCGKDCRLLSNALILVRRRDRLNLYVWIFKFPLRKEMDWRTE